MGRRASSLGKLDRRERDMASAHAKRWVTALVAIPILLLLIAKGGRISVTLLVALVTTLSLLEYFSLVLPDDGTAVKGGGLVVGLVLVLAMSWVGTKAVPVLLVAAFLIFTVICLFNFNSLSVLATLSRQMSGLLYIPFMLGHLILIRDWPQGVTWVFFLLAVVFAGDTAAFYVGRVMGRHKLAPRVSPGKTVEGAIGGLAASVIVGILFRKYCFPEFGLGGWIVLVFGLGALGQTGDLFESMLKRSVDVKDSGWVMPGHGGLLDRIDGLIFAAPGLYYWRTYLL